MTQRVHRIVAVGDLTADLIFEVPSLPLSIGDFQVSETIHLCPKDFAVISGDDFTTLPLLAVGGKGTISVTANIAPANVAGLIDAFEAGDYQKAKKIHYRLWPLNRAMFLETNPIPVKTALSLMKKVSPELRLPLSPMSEANRKKLRQVLKDYKFI